MTKPVEPSVSSKAFSCPHCGVVAEQIWHCLGADAILTKDGIPFIPQMTVRPRNALSAKPAAPPNPAHPYGTNEQVTAGEPFFWPTAPVRGVGSYQNVANLSLCRCSLCKGLTVWAGRVQIYPMPRVMVEPNKDLENAIKDDFNEAGAILHRSPRGAAALLRLALQKLCKQLGEKGEKIDDDIASLVGKGLDKTIQQALDVVRVIGNNAVHPGTMDLKDDAATAGSLFLLVNEIADQMISRKKRVQVAYDLLPLGTRVAIERRNEKALAKASNEAMDEDLNASDGA